MAKKKKSQLKPVARGFATVSVAKKVVPIEAEPETEAIPAQAGGPSSSQVSAASSKLGEQLASDEWDPEKAEEQSLQNLIDKFQDRVEREIVRTIKVLNLFKEKHLCMHPNVHDIGDRTGTPVFSHLS